MSNGDEPADESEEAAEALSEATLEDHLEAADETLATESVDEEAMTTALDAIAGAIEHAETEADLDAIEERLDDAEAALEGADLPEPDDEDENDPREELESRLGEVRDGLEDERGPYAEDVVAVVEDARSTLEDTRWTEDGEGEAVEAVVAFVEAVEDHLDADVETPDDLEEAVDALESVAVAVENADLDPDDDAGTIAALVEATDDLSAGLEAAEEWDDLSVREQLQAEGFYDVLDHRKDFPPEWHALKVWEKRGNAEMVLLALEKFESDFMEEHCLDALARMGPQEAYDTMIQRAGRRDKPAIEILGKIGNEEALDTILEYADADSDPGLQKVTLRAVGEIGSPEATQAVANKLVADNDVVRSRAARTLGMLGDPRAVDPLGDVLAEDDVDTVRASAAWALVQIGTREALEAAAEYADDRSYLVQTEAEQAAEALGAVEA